MNHCSLRSRFTLVGVLVFATFSISSVNALSTNPILNADTNAKAKITGIKVDTSTKIKMNANFQAEDRYKTIPSRSADWKIRLASDIEVFSKYLMRLSSRVDSTPRLSDQGKAKLKTRIVEDTVWINKKKTQLDRFTRVEAQKIPEEIRERKRGYRQLILGNRSYTKTTNKIQTQVSALRDFGMRVDGILVSLAAQGVDVSVFAKNREEIRTDVQGVREVIGDLDKSDKLRNRVFRARVMTVKIQQQWKTLIKAIRTEIDRRPDITLEADLSAELKVIQSIR